MVKYIGTDLDGTLFKWAGDTLTEEFFDLVRFFTSKGVIFAAASGRQYANLREVFREVADDIAYITENGALVYYKGELIHKSVMNHERAIKLANEIQAMEGYDVQLSVPGHYCTHMKEEAFMREMSSLPGMKSVEVECFDDIEEDIVKVAMFNVNGISDALASEMHDRWNGDFTCVRSQRTWYDFIAKDSNKGTGTKALLDYLGIDRADAYSFGDNYNDKEMLEYVGHGYIMDCAVPELRASFKYHTDDVVRVLRELKEKMS